MTYESLRDTVGREPVTIVEIDLDKCTNTYGGTFLPTPEGTCTATQTDGVETVNDGAFDSSANWIEGTNWLVTGGVLQASSVTGGAVTFQASLVTLVAGNSYLITYTVSNYSSGTARIILANDTSNTTKNVTANGTYKEIVKLSTINDQLTRIASSGTLTCDIDDLSIQLVSPGTQCFNTRKTCQDVPNFINSSSVSPITPLMLQFSDRLIDGETYIPCIISTKLTPVGITPGQPFNTRASITIVFQDFSHHDRGIDPYVATRSYTPEDQGTFFGKLLSRNPFYQGRALRLKTGYVADPFDTGDLQTQNFIIEKFTGPDKSGNYTVVAKDIMKLADDERSVAPAASTGKLVAAISAGATSLTVTSGTESEYNAESDYIRIGDEIIQAPAAYRSANVFSNLTRGAWNTTAVAHSIDDAVQACKYVNNENIIDIYDDLLTNYAGISSAFIPTSAWQAERDLWLTATNLTALITEPTGVKTLMDELSEQSMTYLWWNAIDQEIPLKAIAPIAVRAVELSDENHIMGKPTVNIVQEDRVSRVLVYYKPRTPIDFSDPKDFQSLTGFIGASEEGVDQYNDVRTRTIFARWITGDALALQVGSRIRNQFRDPPKFIVFDVDAKDSSNVVGDYIDLNTRALLDDFGANEVTAVQILKIEEITKEAPGTHYRLTCQDTQFKGRYARIMANTSPDGDYQSATDADKGSGAFIVAGGLEVFTSDNGQGYKIA